MSSVMRSGVDPVRCCILYLGLLLLTSSGCRKATGPEPTVIPQGISWASLLADAADLRTLAEPVMAGEISRMSSSSADTGKVVLANLAPQIFGDMDHGFFKEVVDEPDGVRATLAEFEGPGAVTWFWSANPIGTLQLFIDNRDQPVLKMSVKDFLGGAFLPVREPFASVTSLGHNLHFPIVHARYCKWVVWVPRRADLSQFYYQVAWRALPRGVDVQAFDVADIRRQAPLLESLGDRWGTISTSRGCLLEGAAPRTIRCSLEPGQANDVFRSSTGGCAIVAIRFAGDSKAALAGLRVHAAWDGVPAVQAPLHMLAGVSKSLEDTESLPATVAGPEVTLRWFMPFRAEGRVTCSNAGSAACSVTVDVWTRPIDASRYPLRFHANYGEYRAIPTDGNTVLTLADVPGSPGRFAGCVLGVDSRSDQWWGEGDHQIWLDGSPAWRGTGTEDYFGFAWCSQGVFHHPLRGQTRVGGDRSHRLAHMHRYHVLDTLPFRWQGKFQFEAWGLGPGTMDWTASILWYEGERSSMPAMDGPGATTPLRGTPTD